MSAQDENGAEAISSEAEIETLPEGIDDPTVLRAELAKKDKAIRQIHARAIKAETLLKERTEKPEVTNETTMTPESKAFEINDEVVDLRLDGYTKDEVAYIVKNGGRKELETPNSYLALAINARRDQLNAEKAASQTTDTANLSEVERKYTPAQLAAMPLKDLEAILPRVS